MFSSKETRYCAVFLIIVIVLINAASLNARKSWGRSSWGKSSSSGGRSGGWGKTSSTGSTWGKSTASRVSRPPAPKPAPKPAPPRPHIPASSGTHTTGTHAKDSGSLIHAEGGGRPRPDPKHQTPHQPTAPADPITKVNAGHVQNAPPTHGSNPASPYPAWANPGAAPHGGANPHAPVAGSPHGNPHPNGFPSNPPIQTRPTGPLTSAPYPPLHPPGPISQPPLGAPHGTFPNSPHRMPSSYPPSPYPVGHPPGMPMPNAPHIGFGNGGHTGGVHQPMGSPHGNYPPVGAPPHFGGAPAPTVIHNHYNAPVGSPPHLGGGPTYGQPPVYGGAPMNQPFVPGHTTVFLPSQQSSGPGLGEMVKQALVFSTVNAGVNRLINGAPHHHHHDTVQSAPAAPAAPGSATPAVTNTVIYNNYGQPTSGGAAPAPGAAPIPGAAPAPGGAPVPPATMPAGQPAFPGVPPSGNTNSPAGNGGSNPSVSGGPSYPAAPPAGNSGTTQTSGNTNGQTSGQAQPTAVPATNANAAAEPPAPQYYISQEELWNLTETLFTKDEFNVSRFVTLNLQNRLTDPNATDVAPAPLMYVEWEAFSIPTISILREIYDNYEFDSNKKEVVNDDTRRKENVLLDAFLDTNIMTTTMTWLSQKGYIEPDSFEWKDTMRHVWMSKINGATSGFERIFLAEKYDGPSILGGQNWVYFNNQESKRRINYLGYVDSMNLGRNSHLVKIHFKIDDATKPNSTMLIGTPPELEMALYTICYYTRPNDACNVSLGGVKFNIYSHAFRYFGKDLIDLGLMFF